MTIKSWEDTDANREIFKAGYESAVAKQRADFIADVLSIWDQTVNIEPPLEAEYKIAHEWLTKTWMVDELAEVPRPKGSEEPGHLGHLDDRPEIRIARTYNGLCVKIALNDRLHDPESELLREFLHQHKDSELVLVPCGGYGNSIGASISWWEIRKEFVPATFWGRIRVRLIGWPK